MADLETLQSNLESHDARLDELGESLGVKQDEYDKRRKRVMVLKNDLTEDQAHLKNSEIELEKRKTRLDTLKEKVAAEGVSPDLSKELEEAQQSFNDKEGQVTELHTRYEQMENKVKAANAEVDAISDELNDLEVELEDLEAKRLSLVQEINEAKSRAG